MSAKPGPTPPVVSLTGSTFSKTVLWTVLESRSVGQDLTGFHLFTKGCNHVQ